MKVVLHLDSDKERRLRLTLNNMKNLLGALEGRSIQAAIVVNGPGAQQVTASMDMGLSELIHALAAEGVDFFVCNNSLTQFGLVKDVLHPAFKVTRAGVLKLVELQRDGYAYVKP
ncbi:DsrE family protein [Desulfoluna sp.]|uniref:DsrE family protein n=1 Tax=Desulfoluna sp. TaxID=2045199 RepID=UPI00262A1D16|nr:DsrE family protein [Desulfoluna sp.]